MERMEALKRVEITAMSYAVQMSPKKFTIRDIQSVYWILTAASIFQPGGAHNRETRMRKLNGSKSIKMRDGT